MEASAACPAYLPSWNEALHKTFIARFVRNDQRAVRLAPVMKPGQELVEAHEDLFQGPLHGIGTRTRRLVNADGEVARLTTTWRGPGSQVSEDRPNQPTSIGHRDSSPFTPPCLDAGGVQLKVGVSGTQLPTLERIKAPCQRVAVLFMKRNSTQDEMSV